MLKAGAQALPGAATPGSVVARIGPNAVLQAAAALRARVGDGDTEALLGRAIGRSLATLPDAMVDEREASRLHQAIVAGLGWREGLAVLRDAGTRTADYLLAHRIPRPVQQVLRHLPARLALRLLARSMAAHSWTFAGSGRFAFHGGARPVFEIAGCPLCRGLDAPQPACAFYAAVFERLLDRIVAAGCRVEESDCEARGAEACRFVVTLGTGKPRPVARQTAPIGSPGRC